MAMAMADATSEGAMTTFRIVPMELEIADLARRTGRSPQYGHPAHSEIATGYGPCRLCLGTFSEGEDRRLLFTYDPFASLAPFPLPGPIFVHEVPCTPYTGGGRFPDELRVIPLTLNAYDAEAQLLRSLRLPNGEVGRPEAGIAELLTDPAVATVHIRNTEAGCYIARAERV